MSHRETAALSAPSGAGPAFLAAAAVTLACRQGSRLFSGVFPQEEAVRGFQGADHGEKPGKTAARLGEGWGRHAPLDLLIIGTRGAGLKVR